MKIEVFHRLFLLLPLLLGGCGVQSKTTCVDPNSDDPACKLDSRRIEGIFQGAAAEADLPICNEEREGRLYYIKETGGFKLCSKGKNIDVSVAGPQGPAGANGADGNGNGSGTTAVNPSTSGLLAPGAALTLVHNLNTLTPQANAYFARNGLLRPIDQYQRAVGRRSLLIAGPGWSAVVNPQVTSLSNGDLAVLHENFPDQAQHTVVVDIYSDEGEQKKLAVKQFPQLITIKALAVSNGVLIVYEPVGSANEYFTVLANDGTTVIAPTLLGVSPGNSRIKDLKLLSNGNAVVSEQFGGNAAGFRIIDPVNGLVVSSNSNAAISSDARTYAAPLEGKFLLFFTDVLSTPHARVAIFNNDGTLDTASASAGVDDETILGSETIAPDRVALVTSIFNDVSSTLFHLDLSPVRAKTKYSPLSADGSSPVALGNGTWVVCSTRGEGYCVTYDHEGVETYRSGELFESDNMSNYTSIAALGREGRYAVVARNSSDSSARVHLLQSAAGRFDLEVVDANTVRVVNRTVEALPIALGVYR